MQYSTSIGALLISLTIALLLGGCDAVGFLHHRIFNDPARVVRVTTASGQTVELLNAHVDYFSAIGVGRHDRSADYEGLGLRTTEGVLRWSEFTSLSIRRASGPARDAGGTSENGLHAEVQLKSGGKVTRVLYDTPARGLMGWQKSDDLPVNGGHAWAEIPLRSVVSMVQMEPVWERVPGRFFETFDAKAQRIGGGSCEGEARVNRPIPVQQNVITAQNESDFAVWVEDGDLLRALDLKDIREIAVRESKDRKFIATFTFNNGAIRTYPVRNAYFDWNYNGPGCRQVSLYEIQSLRIAPIAH